MGITVRLICTFSIPVIRTHSICPINVNSILFRYMPNNWIAKGLNASKIMGLFESGPTMLT